MARKLIYDEVKHYIEEESSSGCKLLSKEYVGSKDEMYFKCKCGNVFKTTFNRFKSLGKRQCDVCSGQIQWSYDKIKEFIEVTSDSGCKLLSKDYKTVSHKLKIKCRCDNDFYVRFNDFYSKNQRQCKICGHKNGSTERRLSYEEVKSYIEYDSGSGCKLLSDKYINCNTKISLLCRCGNKFKTTFVEFKHQKKYLCNSCSKERQNINSSKTHEQFCINVERVLGSDYTVVSRYKNSSTKVKINHIKCGYTYMANPTDITSNGSGCPRCNRSKGEREIEKWLINQNIPHICEYSFDDCLSKRNCPLRFDFYLPKHNICIEYDGEGHYEPFRFSEDKNKMIRKLKQIQQNDNIKNQYCKDNGIPLLRIPYWEFDNIEQILEEWLEKHDILQKSTKVS